MLGLFTKGLFSWRTKDDIKPAHLPHPGAWVDPDVDADASRIVRTSSLDINYGNPEMNDQNYVCHVGVVVLL